MCPFCHIFDPFLSSYRMRKLSHHETHLSEYVDNNLTGVSYNPKSKQERNSVATHIKAHTAIKACNMYDQSIWCGLHMHTGAHTVTPPPPPPPPPQIYQLHFGVRCTCIRARGQDLPCTNHGEEMQKPETIAPILCTRCQGRGVEMDRAS